MKENYIKIKGAKQNNLKNIDVEIPHHRFIVVSGVSGSGKSSLAFDIIAEEGKKQYLESIPSFVRQYSGKMANVDIDEISGLFPVISVEQSKTNPLSSSTLGTLSNLYDYLRLLYARFGEAKKGVSLSRSLFSFNTAIGACPQCRGLGIEERISVDKLIADPNKTLREGALVPSQPNGYIMYSQITIDVLDSICKEHGFSVDIPWKDLTEEQKDVVLNGSDKIKVLFGKHSLESRLKWKALKAKPREEGYYRGMLPIMEEILKRDRNKNILRFVEAVKCSKCGGKRLNDQALSVKYRNETIDYLSELRLSELLSFFKKISTKDKAEKDIISALIRDITFYCTLGMAHHSIATHSSMLTTGERQRIKLVNQLSAKLSNVIYVFDEPSIGMHPRDNKVLIEIFKGLVSQGNTLIVVEHDLDMIRAADWIIEVGPGAGIHGGELLYNGNRDNFLKNNKTPTQQALHEHNNIERTKTNGENISLLRKDNEESNILLQEHGINLLCGVPGSGKRQFIQDVFCKEISNYIEVDQKPIGKTPRSNPATYTGLANYIRDLFAAIPEVKEKGFTKTHFSFNTKGGRCEHCQGAGKIQIGMHYMGNVEILCDHCKGKRFKDEILDIKYKGKSIADVYDMSIEEALLFFAKENKILPYLEVLDRLGLGYIQLGQSSTTLSGGEAQRIKLATALVKQKTKPYWYILHEATTGMHYDDVQRLVLALNALCEKGNSVLCIEHHPLLLQSANRIIEFGQQSSDASRGLVFQGDWDELKESSTSPTAKVLKKETLVSKTFNLGQNINRDIYIRGARTNNLKNINVEFPKEKITVLTGISGSGKTSLAFDTLFSEAQSRFTESFSTYSRSFIKQSNKAEADVFENLSPSIAINRKNLPSSPRSTVGTLTGIYEKYRFLYSRYAQERGYPYTAKDFSFNSEFGACPHCSGLGVQMKASPEALVPDTSLSIEEGAFTHNSIIRYYGNPDGQYVAILKEIANTKNIDLSKPISALTKEELDIVLYGTGDMVWETEWEFKTKTQSGTQQLRMPWKGFAGLIEEEYARSEHNKNFTKIAEMMHEVKCSFCNGGRLKKESLDIEIEGKNIAGLSALSILETKAFFASLEERNNPIISFSFNQIKDTLDRLIQIGLGHLSIDRRSSTLSGGEGQRLRLAQQLSSSLEGICYVLDEPTIGLHKKDVSSLWNLIEDLKAKGNTIVIVEHDKEIIKRADKLIEIGPGSGKDGGTIVAQGAPNEVEKNASTLTTKYLKDGVLPKAKDRSLHKNAFGFKGVDIFSIQKKDFYFHAGGIIAITGVSGAGKSTLMHKVIHPSITKKKAYYAESYYDNVGFDEVVQIKQEALKTTKATTVFSYSGLMKELSLVYKDNENAKALGIKANNFVYTSKEGKCEHCAGLGSVKISMDFMDDVWNKCEVCNGRRYNSKQECVEIQGKSIAGLLEMSIDALFDFTKGIKHKKRNAILSTLEELQSIGLGHLVLGQSIASLSGGETQRIRMCVKMLEIKEEKILFLLDEPSSGLHYADLDKLIKVFERLTEKGHTVMFIEHNPYLISVANQVVSL